MSGRFESELCRTLLEERFGRPVTLVASTLMREPSGLPILATRLKGQLPVNMIRRALCVLEQHGVVTFSLDSAMRVQYAIDQSTILALGRASRCTCRVKTLYGALAENVFLELVYKGRLTCSETLRRLSASHGYKMSQTKEKFCRLAEAQFIKRCPPIEHRIGGCPVFAQTYDPFIMPDLILEDTKQIMETGLASGNRKRKANDGPVDRDEGIYWRVNWARFDRYMRDELVLDLLVPKVDEITEVAQGTLKNTVWALLKANELRSTLLTSHSTSHISVSDIVRVVRENELRLEKKEIDWALKLLADESRGVLRKVGDSAGGLFVIDFEKAVTQLCQSEIEALIRENLDSKAVRIFRLLQSKGYLEEDQIEKLTMMSSKETRDLLYAMLEEGYIHVKPLGRTNDFAPARTFYLYYVNMQQTARTLVEYVSKMMRNIIVRLQYESAEKKKLIDNHELKETIMDGIRADESKDEQAKEEECAHVERVYMPDADRLVFDKFLADRIQLITAEVEAEKTLFALKLYIHFFKALARHERIRRGLQLRSLD